MFSLNDISWFTSIPADIVIFVLSIIPIAERFAIPIGIGVYHLSWWHVYIITVIGNTIPIVIVFQLLDVVSKFLMKHSVVMNRAFTWWFAHTEKIFSAHYEKYGLVGLIFLTAMPLPITGAWTAASAAWLFRLPRMHAAMYIVIGIMIANALITSAIMGIITIGNHV